MKVGRKKRDWSTERTGQVKRSLYQRKYKVMRHPKKPDPRGPEVTLRYSVSSSGDLSSMINQPITTLDTKWPPPLPGGLYWCIAVIQCLSCHCGFFMFPFVLILPSWRIIWNLLTCTVAWVWSAFQVVRGSSKSEGLCDRTGSVFRTCGHWRMFRRFSREEKVRKEKLKMRNNVLNFRHCVLCIYCFDFWF